MKSRVRMGLVALALSAVGCGDSPSPSALSFAESTIVFPDTVIDRVEPSSVRSIAVRNGGNSSVTPTFALADDADFAIKSTTCDVLAPGASCDVVVQFEPHTLGARSIDLIATGAGSSGSATLVGMSLPEPGFSSVPMSALSYEDVAVGATKTLRVTVWNRSAVTARTYSVALAGVDVQDFAVAADGCSGGSAVPNGSCIIDVTFAPTATSPRSAQLVVSSGNLGSLMIALDGNGYRPAELAVAPGSGMFGSVFELGESLAQSFTVTNSGTVPSPQLQVTISGPDHSYFALTDGCSGSTLAGGASCMFSIVYQPGQAGMHQASATVSAGTLGPVVVPLTGIGEPAQIAITPSGWSFGQVLVGQTTGAETFTVENTGSTNTGALTIGLWVSSSEFTVVSDGCTGVDLAPGATCSFGATATPTGRNDSFASLFVSATRGDKAMIGLQVQGINAATLTPMPTAVAFGDVQMTETPSQSITVSNMGDLDTGTLAVAVVGDDRADVTLVEDCTGQSLRSFWSCSLTVSFSPSHLGAETAAIQIASPGVTQTIPVTANTLPAPTITVSPNTLVLNPVAVGESYTRTFVVQGTGAATGPLTVALTGANAADYAVTDDSCSGSMLASGQACTIEVTLTPSATGSRNAVLVVSGQPGGYRKVPITGIAFTQATLTISRSTVMFAATGVGQTDTFGFLTIKNAGQLPTGMLTAQLVGADATEFGVIADTCTSVVLAPNATCSVHTKFVPTQIQNSTASLVVSAMPGGTVSAALSGMGLPPPVISSMITSYDFAPQETFTERQFSVRIYNVGGSPTDHLHASLTGPQASEFGADDHFCDRIPAGGVCDVFVDFHPTDVGQASATLVVDSALAGSVTIALTGTATPGVKVAVSPDSWDFGYTPLGQDGAVKTFIASNIGQRDVTMFTALIDSQFCENFTVLSTTCGSTLAPNASCRTDVLHHPVSSPYPYCRLVFVENTLVIGEAALLGQTGP